MRHHKISIFLISQLLFFLISFFAIQFLMKQSFRQFQNQELELFATTISTIQDESIRKDVIHALLTEADTEEGYQILEHYGITSPKQLNNLNRFSEIETNAMSRFYNIYGMTVLFFFLGNLTYLYLRYRDTKKIRVSLNRVLSGDYNFDVKGYHDSDFDSLATDIYKITSLLKENTIHVSQEKKQLESVLSDISHQLKTPLTSMYVINDLLKDDKIDSKKRRELLYKNHNQLERIEWLVATLLKMSRLDSGMVTLKQEEVSIKDLLQKVMEPLQIPMELKGQEIVLGQTDMSLFIDSHWTLEALLNIVKNAYEHTPVGGRISIHWNENPLYYEIIIEDNGNGIKKSELPHIFERFYKGSSNKESIGIGLNMSKTIIEKQNGVIQVTSEEGVGTTFLIRFYKKIV